MSSSRRRFEVLLPQRFNDGSPVPAELFVQTYLDLRSRFGAVSWQSQSVEGEWEHAGTVYRDSSTRMFVDVPDSPENRQFFVQYKEVLKERFGQIDIWMTAYSVDVL